MKAKLVFVTVPAKDPQRLAAFYEKFFGIDFGLTYGENVVSYHAPILREGVQLSIQQWFRQNDTTTCYYAVDDIAAAVAEVKEGGGQVVSDPRPLPILPPLVPIFRLMAQAFFDVTAQETAQATTIGTGAVLADPEGNQLGLIQFEPFMHAMYCIGRHTEPLSATQLSSHKLTSAIGRLFEQLRPPAQPRR